MEKESKIKVNIFKKIRNELMVFAARLQKAFFTEKTAIFTLSKLNETLVKELITAIGEKEAMEKIFQSAAELGHEFMVELSPTLVKDIKSMPAYAKAAWLLFSGHKLSHIEFKHIEIGGYKCLSIQFQDKDCPWCRDIAFSSNFCAFPAGAYNGAGQTWAELTGNPYNFFVRETRCKAKGDPYCEFIFLAAPKVMPIEVLKNEHPEWFETISFGFFEF